MIKWSVIVGDFVLLNAVMYVFSKLDGRMTAWDWERMRMFFLLSNFAMVISEVYFHTTIHRRLVSAGDVVRTVMLLTVTQAVIAYIMMKHMLYMMSVGNVLLAIGTVMFLLLIVKRLMERILIKHMRRMGHNMRTVTFVGSDAEIRSVYEQLVGDPTTGYRMLGYYADEKLADDRIAWLGTVSGLIKDIKNGEEVTFGDELYVCLSRKNKENVKLLSRLCDRQVTKFYYVPLSVESIGLNLKRELINDIEIYTTHESPLLNPVNKLMKRTMDIILSRLFLIPTALIFPIIYLIIKIQSPGPIFFKQDRTGLDGKSFKMIKFRSMHVNKDADKIQATKDDPRKYPFGNFMRKANIDELPQFWNVLMGDMSIVGPRPHMLAHTRMYSELIDKYMVRHFVKPGITGWAQVTGFRGETKELWQMEGRVKRDIWYMENWTIWLDIRIVWLTVKTIFVHDKNAY